MDLTPTWRGILYIIIEGIQKRTQSEGMLTDVRQLADIGDDYGTPGTYKPGHWKQRVEELIVRLKGTKGRRSAAIEAAVKELYTLAAIADKAVEESKG